MDKQAAKITYFLYEPPTEVGGFLKHGISNENRTARPPSKDEDFHLKIIKFFEKNYNINDIAVGSEPFHVLISCIISQRTRDSSTEKASNQLFAVAKTPKQIASLSLRKIELMIKPSGFYKQKAKRIKQVAKAVLDMGYVPKTREELMKLKGVGFKTADITRMYGHGIPSIAVDTHVNRIPKRIGLVQKDTNLEQVKEQLEHLFPKIKWHLVNHGFVRFGQTICLPVKPKCNICQFNIFCDYYKSSVKK